MSIYIMVCYFLLIVLLMICVHLIKCSREVISYRALLEEETVLAIAFLLCYTDTGTGIGYDTYRIRGYALSQKTLIRGYG